MPVITRVVSATRTYFLLAVAAVCLAGTGHAAVFSPKSFKLDNGLQVVVIENSRAPIVMQMLWYRVGAADEEPGESGLAHFLEHLLFKGTKTTAPGEFSRTVARIGGRDNAFTSYDYTAYFQRVAAHELETIMRLEADRMQNLVLTDEVVLPERDVVLEERRSRTDNSPAAQLREQVRRALYLNHPYGRPVIGWMSEIKQLNKEKALAFYRKHYAPSNAMLIIAGDVNGRPGPGTCAEILRSNSRFRRASPGSAKRTTASRRPACRVAKRAGQASFRLQNIPHAELCHRRKPGGLSVGGTFPGAGRGHDEPSVS